MTASEFRAALRALRLTQHGFADRLGVARSTVSRWVSGEFAVPRYAALILELLAERGCQARPSTDRRQ